MASTILTPDTLTPKMVENLMNMPAAIPPDGVVPNFINPPNVTEEKAVAVHICLVVGTLAFAMRTYTRLFLMRKFQLEDYFLTLSYCFLVALAGILYRVSYTGTGLVHQWDMRVKDTERFLYYFRLVAIIYSISLAFVKVSILVQYLNLFAVKGQRGVIYWACHAIIWLNVLYYVVHIFIEAIPCRPVNLSWSSMYQIFPDGRCINVDKLRVGVSCVNVLSDVVIFLLPQKVIWSLKLSTRKKIGISAAFAAGVTACVCSVVRLYYVVKFYRTPIWGDRVRTGVNMGTWLVPEVACAILATALPVAPKFYQFIRGTSLASALRTRFSRTEVDSTGRNQSQTLVGYEVSCQAEKGEKWYGWGSQQKDRPHFNTHRDIQQDRKYEVETVEGEALESFMPPDRIHPQTLRRDHKAAYNYI